MVSAILAVAALAFRWSVERRAIVLIKFPPALWLAFLYAGLTFNWFHPLAAPLAYGVGQFIRFTFSLILLSQAVSDYFTAREILRLKRGVRPSGG